MDVFRNIFGKVSGGLSVFADNPFQRKREEADQPNSHGTEDHSSHRKREGKKEVQAVDGSQETEASDKKKKKKKKKKTKKKNEKKKRASENDNTEFEENRVKRKKEGESTSEKGPRIKHQNLDGHSQPLTRSLKNHGLNRPQEPSAPKASKKRNSHEDPSLQGSKRPITHESHQVHQTRKGKLEVEHEPATHGSKRKHVDLVEERYEKRRKLVAMTHKLEGLELKENAQTKDSPSIPGEQQSDDRKREREEGRVEDVTQKRRTLDDEERLRRTIFVGNLPLSALKKEIIKEFSVYGAVESVRLRSVPLKETKLPRKGAIINGQINEAIDSMHAYIVFKGEDCAKAALACNMKEFKGNHIRVDTAYAPCKVSKDMLAIYDRTRSIFLGNVPFDVKDEELYQLFGVGKESDMEVEAVRVVRDPQTSLCKGIAFILFKSKVGANHALSKDSVKLRGRELRIFRVRASQLQEPSRPKAYRMKDEVDGGQRKHMKKVPPAYQGICASKTGTHQNRWTASNFEARNAQKRPHKENIDGRQLKKKRPAVAARKSYGLNSARTVIPTGNKRKRAEKQQRGSSRAKKIRRR